MLWQSVLILTDFNIDWFQEYVQVDNYSCSDLQAALQSIRSMMLIAAHAYMTT